MKIWFELALPEMLAGVVNLIFDVVLVVSLGAGIRGAAVATAGSQICMASVLLIALLREGRRRRDLGGPRDDRRLCRSTACFVGNPMVGIGDARRGVPHERLTQRVFAGQLGQVFRDTSDSVQIVTPSWPTANSSKP
mgnify:CR=1 FL=1